MERKNMPLLRILILSAMFFTVGLCSRGDMALAVFALGIAVYSFLWWRELYESKKK